MNLSEETIWNDVKFQLLFFSSQTKKKKKKPANDLHNDAIGLPDRPQCSNLSVFNDDVNIDFPKLIAFVSDSGVPRVVKICNA